MRRVHRWRPPRWFRLWMILATRGGDGWLWYSISALVVAFGGHDRFAAITAAWAACGAGAVLFLVLKKLTGRKRPNTLVPHCWATLLPPDQFSFPFRPHDHRLRLHTGHRQFLSPPDRRIAVLRLKRGDVAHYAGNALPERCRGGSDDGRGAGLRGLCYFCLTGFAARLILPALEVPLIISSAHSAGKPSGLPSIRITE